MTKLPETISKFFVVFSGEEVSDNTMKTARYIMAGRRSGRTTASIIRGIGFATESSDGALIIDHHTSTLHQAEHNADIARKLISAMNLSGYEVAVKSLYNLQGLHPYIVGERSGYNQFCVHITFNPIVEVNYDLRK
ncbi:hypothetical protein HOR53_gp32 [Pectobacterium phage PP99]|uniref:Uncharacterized protein n=1 Tax=Pectobacterium phage PP99 TaxID=1932883 RepID=A0A1P8L642_9CAUD|nr:hypothetical protein HOR53_gp32 [Pectobacterium phage PP99]APW79723.1 hypothetical protein PP99_32 [Pectobacterium phage PP99]